MLPIRTKKKPSETETKKAVKEGEINPNNKITITWRCPNLLLTRAKNSLVSKKNSGNYSLANFSDLVRQSLLAYQQGMKLTEPRDDNSPRKVIAVCLDQELFNFYNSLPAGNRSAILERVLASYLIKN
ncbi:MAG: hypothetical protein mread185_000339 [Mycoplasmataceae bacterium]|nr:MAG: hypothetical protein mread185_000339 [Mycoplasmataceae bacterium]